MKKIIRTSSLCSVSTLIITVVAAAFSVQALAQDVSSRMPRLLLEPTAITFANSALSDEISEPNENSGQPANLFERDISPLPPPTFVMDAESQASINQLAPHINAVGDLETSGGAYNPELVEALFSLGRVYRQQGNFDKAFEIYDRVFHISRIQNGLFYKGQIQIIQAIYDTYLEQGNLSEALVQQQYLYYLKQKIHQGSPEESLQTHIDYANWNFDFSLNAYHFNQGRSYEFLLLRQSEASNQYSRALKELELTTKNQNPLFEPVVMQFVRSNYYLAYFFSRQNRITMSFRRGSVATDSLSQIPVQQIQVSYKKGKDALTSRINRLKNNSTPDTEQIILAMIDLADWQQAFLNNRKAEDMYEQAYSLLQSSQLENYDQLVSAFFQPAMPQHIPAYIAPDYSLRAYGINDTSILEEAGYVDVSFQVDRHGKTGAMQILNSGSEISNTQLRTLQRHISNSLYRPSYNDDVTAEARTYYVRYHVSELFY